MDDLVTWLRAQLDEDERVARACAPGPWELSGLARETFVSSATAGVAVAMGWLRDATHIARHDPARVLAEVAAKRAIVELHDSDGGAHECPDGKDVIGPHTGYERDCLTLRHLAAVYADRPGYRPKWAPDPSG